MTIFGTSAGSLDVSALMTSPLSKGLFQRAIAQSGAVILAGDPLVLSHAEKRGEAAAARWAGSEAASLEALRALSVTQILDAEPDLARNADTLGKAFPNLGITVDGYVFPRKPADAFASGQQHRVPLLLGNNAHEVIPGTQPPTDLKKAIADVYGPLAARAEALYGGTDPVPNTASAQWATDTSFRCPTVAQSLWHAAAGHATYAYEFARVLEARQRHKARAHADADHARCRARAVPRLLASAEPLARELRRAFCEELRRMEPSPARRHGHPHRHAFRRMISTTKQSSWRASPAGLP